MITELHEDELEVLSKALRTIKVLKVLKDKGYGIDNYSLDFADLDIWEAQHELQFLLDNILGALGFTYESYDACDERGEFIGYSMIMDPDEMYLLEMDIFHPELDKYLSRAKKKEVDIYDTAVGHKIARLISINHYNDYEVQESFVAEDLSCMCFLVNVYDFVTDEFVDDLINMVAICETENKLDEIKIIERKE